MKEKIKTIIIILGKIAMTLLLITIAMATIFFDLKIIYCCIMIFILLGILISILERNSIFDEIKEIKKRQVNIPVPIKRFTFRSKNKVEIYEGCLPELLLYLADLEDYFESIGKL